MNNTTQKISRAVPLMAEKEGKYLTFTLAGEDYGIGILLDIDRVLKADEIELLERAA